MLNNLFKMVARIIEAWIKHISEKWSCKSFLWKVLIVRFLGASIEMMKPFKILEMMDKEFFIFKHAQIKI